jgi:hypothetical protein
MSTLSHLMESMKPSSSLRDSNEQVTAPLRGGQCALGTFGIQTHLGFCCLLLALGGTDRDRDFGYFGEFLGEELGSLIATLAFADILPSLTSCLR